MRKLCISLFLAGVLALADGVVVFEPGSLEPSIEDADQEAIIYYNKGWEILILSVTYKGPSLNFAWLIPTPSPPDVSIAPGDIFGKVEDMAGNTRGNIQPPLEPFMQLENPLGAPGVKVKERKQIGFYDIAVLPSGDPEELLNWCNNAGYRIPPNAAPILKEYVEKGWCFTAVRINGAEFGPGILFGQFAPLRLKFATSRIIYPLKISYINRLSLSPKVVIYDELCGHPVIFGKEKEEIIRAVIRRTKEDLRAHRRFEGSILYRLGFGELYEVYERTLANLQREDLLLNLIKMKVEEDVKNISEKERNTVVMYVIAPFKVDVGRETNRQLASFIEIPYSLKIRTKWLGNYILGDGDTIPHSFPRKVYITKIYGTPYFASFQNDLVLVKSTSSLKFAAFLICLFGPLIYIGIGTRLQNSRLQTLLKMLEETGRQLRQHLYEREKLLSQLVSFAWEYVKDKSVFAELQKVHQLMVRERNVEEKARWEERLKEKMAEIFLLLENTHQLGKSQNFNQLRELLVRLERQIDRDMVRYIKLVRDHNQLIKSIPIVFFRKPSPFEEEESLAYRERFCIQ